MQESLWLEKGYFVKDGVEYVIGIVEENLGDIKEFMKQIGGFLKRE